MRLKLIAIAAGLLAALVWPLYAQDLSPRAFVITPVNSNAVTLICSFFDGKVNFNTSIAVRLPRKKPSQTCQN